MTTLRTFVLVVAALSMGLAAGLFYTFQVAVMRGLARTDDRTFVAAMQWINVKILNFWFALSFGGALVLALLSAVLFVGADDRTPFWWIVAGLVLYVITIGITGGRNVPTNNALNAAGDPNKVADLAAVRRAFEGPWVRWNLVRTWTSLLAFLCLILAVLTTS
jgi:uncharacterized membrane protein